MAAACVLLSLLTACLVFLHVDSENCREGWHFHGGSCYSFGDSLVTWGDAQTICATSNGHLAEIETSEENEFLKNISRTEKVLNTFLGGTDVFDEGVWVWASSGNNIYPFVDWAPGEPNELQGEDCLVFYGVEDYRWDDFYCNMPANFICEVKATDLPVVG
ncbi:hypothetical protein BsWGS_28418 [Bradybaena similaris]